jgi:hypothetical protein
MLQKQQFTIISKPQVKISFLREFINNGGYGLTISYLENLDIWTNIPHKIIVDGEGVYNNESYQVVSMIIPFLALKNNAEGLTQKIKAIAKYNNTIAFYQHGTFQVGYDFRDNQ